MKNSTALFLSVFALSACATAPPAPFSSGPDSLAPPVRIEAGGALIDTSDCVAHSGPHLLDVDGDGLQDLIVGDFVGHAHIHRNIATDKEPVLAAGQQLEANGEVVRIPNW